MRMARWSVPALLCAGVLLFSSLYLLQGCGSEDQETDAVFVPTEERIQLSVPPLSERACWSGDPEAEGHDNILAATGPAGGCPFIVLGRNAAYISGVEGVLRTFPPSACREYDLDRLTVTICAASSFAEKRQIELTELLRDDLKEWVFSDLRISACSADGQPCIGISLSHREKPALLPGRTRVRKVLIGEDGKRIGSEESEEGDDVDPDGNVQEKERDGDGTGEKLAVTKGTGLLALSGYLSLEPVSGGGPEPGTMIRVALSELPADAPVRGFFPEDFLREGEDAVMAGFWFPEGLDDIRLWQYFCPALRFDLLESAREEYPGWYRENGVRHPVTEEMIRERQQTYARSRGDDLC